MLQAYDWFAPGLAGHVERRQPAWAERGPGDHQGEQGWALAPAGSSHRRPSRPKPTPGRGPVAGRQRGAHGRLPRPAPAVPAGPHRRTALRQGSLSRKGRGGATVPAAGFTDGHGTCHGWSLPPPRRARLSCLQPALGHSLHMSPCSCWAGNCTFHTRETLALELHADERRLCLACAWVAQCRHSHGASV